MNFHYSVDTCQRHLHFRPQAYKRTKAHGKLKGPKRLESDAEASEWTSRAPTHSRSSRSRRHAIAGPGSLGSSKTFWAWDRKARVPRAVALASGLSVASAARSPASDASLTSQQLLPYIYIGLYEPYISHIKHYKPLFCLLAMVLWPVLRQLLSPPVTLA